jgi:L-asparaginase II
MGAAPVAVEVWRGGRVESRHRVALAVVATDGRPLWALGDTISPVYPRSALKPLQALPLVASGAADAVALDMAELALACASHSGEPMHVERVAAWLERLGVAADELACGPHPPIEKAAAERWVRAGAVPSRLLNNCSGKHAGMVTLACHLGAPLRGYERPDHPVQRVIAEHIAAAAGLDVLPGPGTDGCAVPNWPLPLGAFALAFARFAAGALGSAALAAAARRITAAMRAHPELVAGTGRCCTALMAAVPQVIAKTGAEGVYVAGLPERGIGIALKVEDGAGRAAEVALLAVLEALGALDAAARERLAAFIRPPLRNTAGSVVGEIAAVPGWPQSA